MAVRGDTPGNMPLKITPSRIWSGVRVRTRFQNIPRLDGQLGSGMCVSASFKIFSMG